MLSRILAGAAAVLVVASVTVSAWPGAIGSASSAASSAATISKVGMGTAMHHAVTAMMPRLGSAGLPPTGWIVTAHAPLAIYSAPGANVVETLPATNPFRNPTTLAVSGVPQGDWAQVLLPQKPNGSLGWVHTPDVAMTWTPYRVNVSRADHQVVVTDGTATVFSSPVSVGTSIDPTPAGNTFLYELIKMPYPNGPYGPWIFGLALYSDAIQSWNGLTAQIGMHGNDEPAGIGHSVSHGCIRLPNSAITTLVGALPLGTPVTVT